MRFRNRVVRLIEEPDRGYARSADGFYVLLSAKAREALAEIDAGRIDRGTRADTVDKHASRISRSETVDNKHIARPPSYLGVAGQQRRTNGGARRDGNLVGNQGVGRGALRGRKCSYKLQAIVAAQQDGIHGNCRRRGHAARFGIGEVTECQPTRADSCARVE